MKKLWDTATLRPLQKLIQKTLRLRRLRLRLAVWDLEARGPLDQKSTSLNLSEWLRQLLQ